MIVLYIILGLVLAAAAVMLVISYKVFMGFAARRDGKKDYDEAYGNDPALVEYFNGEVEYFRSLSPQRLTLELGDKLVGWYYPSKGGKLVMLVHGWRDDSRMRMANARAWIDAGYGVFIPDLRAHGDSEGKYIGMGCVDRGDIIKWIKLLEGMGERQFVLFGVSMGCVTVCALSGDDDLPKSVRAIIGDCGYTSLRELFIHLMRKDGLPGRLTAAFTSFWCKAIAGYDFTNGSPIEQVTRSHTPTLFIHGEKDRFVPFEMCRRLYDACSAPDKEYWPVPNAVHARSFWTARGEYERRTIEFAERHMDK